MTTIQDKNLPIYLQKYTLQVVCDGNLSQECGSIEYSTVGVLPSNVKKKRVWNLTGNGTLKKHNGDYILLYNFSKVDAQFAITFQNKMDGLITVCGRVLDANKCTNYSYDLSKKTLTITIDQSRWGFSVKRETEFSFDLQLNDDANAFLTFDYFYDTNTQTATTGLQTWVSSTYSGDKYIGTITLNEEADGTNSVTSISAIQWNSFVSLNSFNSDYCSFLGGSEYNTCVPNKIVFFPNIAVPGASDDGGTVPPGGVFIVDGSNTIHWFNSCTQCNLNINWCDYAVQEDSLDGYTVGESVKNWGCENISSVTKYCENLFTGEQPCLTYSLYPTPTPSPQPTSLTFREILPDSTGKISEGIYQSPNGNYYFQFNFQTGQNVLEIGDFTTGKTYVDTNWKKEGNDSYELIFSRGILELQNVTTGKTVYSTPTPDGASSGQFIIDDNGNVYISNKLFSGASVKNMITDSSSSTPTSVTYDNSLIDAPFKSSISSYIPYVLIFNNQQAGVTITGLEFVFGNTEVFKYNGEVTTIAPYQTVQFSITSGAILIKEYSVKFNIFAEENSDGGGSNVTWTPTIYTEGSPPQSIIYGTLTFNNDSNQPIGAINSVTWDNLIGNNSLNAKFCQEAGVGLSVSDDASLFFALASNIYSPNLTPYFDYGPWPKSWEGLSNSNISPNFTYFDLINYSIYQPTTNDNSYDSPEGKYRLTFDTNGHLTLTEVNTSKTLWSTVGDLGAVNTSNTCDYLYELSSKNKETASSMFDNIPSIIYAVSGNTYYSWAAYPTPTLTGTWQYIIFDDNGNLYMAQENALVSSCNKVTTTQQKKICNFTNTNFTSKMIPSCSTSCQCTGATNPLINKIFPSYLYIQNNQDNPLVIPFQSQFNFAFNTLLPTPYIISSSTVCSSSGVRNLTIPPGGAAQIVFNYVPDVVNLFPTASVFSLPGGIPSTQSPIRWFKYIDSPSPQNFTNIPGSSNFDNTNIQITNISPPTSSANGIIDMILNLQAMSSSIFVFYNNSSEASPTYYTPESSCGKSLVITITNAKSDAHTFPYLVFLIPFVLANEEGTTYVDYIPYTIQNTSIGGQNTKLIITIDLSNGSSSIVNS